jgi:nucleoside diphosphate kinase
VTSAVFRRPLAPILECAIVLLKPDAIERGLDQVIVDELRASGLELFAEREVQLTADDLHRYFLHPLPAYIAHMTSRPLRCFLARGADVYERLYARKIELRAALGVESNLKNLIHTADEGTEYHRQLGRFYPDLPARDRTAAADLDVRFPDSGTADDAVAVLRDLEARSALRYVVPVFGAGQDAQLAAVRAATWPRLGVAPAALVLVGGPRRIELLVHLAVDDDLGWTALGSLDAMTEALAARPRAVTIADLAITADELARYAHHVRTRLDDIDELVAAEPLFADVEALRRAGCTRLACFAPHLALMEVELRGDLARLAGLYVGGGSAGRAIPGEFSISYYKLAGTDLEAA